MYLLIWLVYLTLGFTDTRIYTTTGNTSNSAYIGQKQSCLSRIAAEWPLQISLQLKAMYLAAVKCVIVHNYFSN